MIDITTAAATDKRERERDRERENLSSRTELETTVQEKKIAVPLMKRCRACFQVSGTVLGESTSIRCNSIDMILLFCFDD